MKIQQLNFATISNVPINNKNRQRDISYNRNYESISNIYYQPVGINSTKAYKTVLFRGHKVHIIDGGIHAKHMKHFAKFVRADFDLSMHDVAINSKDKNIKQLESIYSQLVKLNSTKIEKGEYVAIPALASVPLLNIKDQYEKIMGESEYFTPENIKSKKEKLIKFLKKIYEDASYKTYVRYMDPVEQGFEYVYPIIQEVNKLVSKGVGVYIPSGHPIDGSLKWLAKEKKQDVELYHYIATGEDINNSVKNMVDEIKRLNWYSFNLLTLSDANIIGLKDKSWNKDYIYSAFDSCVTESARGVYNLSPVRSVGRVIGYSFSDKLLNDYPYDEFPLNDQVSNILKYVYLSILSNTFK